VEQTREINKHGEEIHLLPVVEKQRGSRRSKVISCAQAKHSATCRESWWEWCCIRLVIRRPLTLHL